MGDQGSSSCFFGRYLVEQGVVSEEALEQGLRLQMDMNKRIGALAVSQGFMTPDQVDLAFEEQQRSDAPFGTIALERGWLTREQLDDLLFSQVVHSTYIGEALLELGHLTQEQFSEHLDAFTRCRNEQLCAIQAGLHGFSHHDLLDAVMEALERAFLRFVGRELRIEIPVPSSRDGLENGSKDFRYHILVQLEDRRSLGCVLFVSRDVAAGLDKTLISPEVEDSPAEGCLKLFGIVRRYLEHSLGAKGLPVVRGQLEVLEPGGLLGPDPEELLLRLMTSAGPMGLAMRIGLES